jgi:hypothetical protein
MRVWSGDGLHDIDQQASSVRRTRRLAPCGIPAARAPGLEEAPASGQLLAALSGHLWAPAAATRFSGRDHLQRDPVDVTAETSGSKNDAQRVTRGTAATLARLC